MMETQKVPGHWQGAYGKRWLRYVTHIGVVCSVVEVKGAIIGTAAFTETKHQRMQLVRHIPELPVCQCEKQEVTAHQSATCRLRSRNLQCTWSTANSWDCTSYLVKHSLQSPRKLTLLMHSHKQAWLTGFHWLHLAQRPLLLLFICFSKYKWK